MVFRSENLFRTTRECEYLFFFQNLTLGYMTKTLNQIIIFFLHQNQNIFFSNIGNQNIFFQKKNHNPPWKLNGPSLRDILGLESVLKFNFCMDNETKLFNIKATRYNTNTYWFLVVKHTPLTPYIKMKYQEKGEIIFSRTGSSKSSS